VNVFLLFLQFSCCGIDGYKDYTNISIFEMPIYPDRDRNFVPASCCWGLVNVCNNNGTIKLMYNDNPWSSSDFFPGEGKNFSDGAKTSFLPKNNKKDTIFFKKIIKTYYFWRGQEPSLAPQPI
jgi:hypothetical protein